MSSYSGRFQLKIAADGRSRQVRLRLGVATIGRDASNTVQLDERNVSRQHLRVTRERRRLYAEDLGSANGTCVNGERVRGRRRIFCHDVIEIGDFQLELVGEGLGDRDDETTERTLAPGFGPAMESTEIVERPGPDAPVEVTPKPGPRRDPDPERGRAPEPASRSERRSERTVVVRQRKATRKEKRRRSRSASTILAFMIAAALLSAAGVAVYLLRGRAALRPTVRLLEIESIPIASDPNLESQRAAAVGPDVAPGAGAKGVESGAQGALSRAQGRAAQAAESEAQESGVRGSDVGADGADSGADGAHPVVGPPGSTDAVRTGTPCEPAARSRTPHRSGTARESEVAPRQDAAARRPAAHKPRLSLEQLNRRAEAQVRAGNLGMAKLMLKRCLARDPHFARCHRTLGITLVRLGDTPAAAFHYSRYVDLEPDAPEADALRRQLEVYRSVGR